MNNLDFYEWINSFPSFINEDEGKLYVIRSPEDINTLHEDLNAILGE